MLHTIKESRSKGLTQNRAAGESKRRRLKHTSVVLAHKEIYLYFSVKSLDTVKSRIRLVKEFKNET